MRKTNLFLSTMLATGVMAGANMTQVSAAPSYPLGVSVEANTNPAWDADYMATFVFQDEDARDAVKVNVKGGFQFYKESETTSYQAFGDNSGIPCYDAYEYEDGMYAASSNVQTGDMDAYEMTEIGDDLFEQTMPLPANQYFYAYYIEYGDGTTADRVLDPANLPVTNVDSNAGWSLFYVGNGETAGQEYIYPSTSAQGDVEYVPYTAIDGTTQYLGVYTPANYDPAKTYKTIYVSHGGGGNEVEWMTIGSVENIMDNLIGAGEVADAIVVTMDNQYFAWDYDKTLPNVLDYIIPKIEADYSVSTLASDRAFCGLSMGSMTTNEMMKRYPEEFGYFGAFSGGNADLDPASFDGAALNNDTLYFTAGTVDIAYNNTMGISTLDYLAVLDDLGVDYDFDLKLGGHDWYVWRDSFTTFVKDYLWNVEYPGASKYATGVTVGNNNDGKYDGDYALTFVYEDQNPKNAVSVKVSGNLQFYDLKDPVVSNFINTGSAAGAKVYNAFEYKDGMFSTGYGLSGDTVAYNLVETDAERFELTLPVPGNLYYYDYTITYSDGSTQVIQDPSNLSLKNTTTGHDAGHSYVYVGQSVNTTEGQEYIYPRTDGKTGTYSYVTYTSLDGSKQPLGVYLPYNYDSSKTYRTLYVSHGGGGNEVEWMTLGALPNIMDNLIAAGDVQNCIVITMDNAYYASTNGTPDRSGRTWDFASITENMEKNIIPYVESHYNVSKASADRALCGLSMGSLTTSTILQTNTDLFGYYGSFSGANVAADVTDLSLLKNVKIYLTAGNVDMALKNATNDIRTTVGLTVKLDDLGVGYNFDLQNGAHDWGVWRSALSTFVKDYLWDVEAKSVTNPNNGNSQSINQEQLGSNATNTNQNEIVQTGDQAHVGTYLAALIMGIGSLYLVSKKTKLNQR